MLEKLFEVITETVTKNPDWLIPVVFFLLLAICLVICYLFARVTAICNTQREHFPVILNRLNTIDKQINHAAEGEETLRERVFKDSNRLARIEGMLSTICPPTLPPIKVERPVLRETECD